MVDDNIITKDTPLSKVMSRNMITLQLDDRTSLVDILMKHNPIHHLPVLQGKVLKGLVTQRDLYRNMLSTYFYESEKEQHEFLDTFTDLSSLMTKDPLTLTPDQTVGEALHLVLEYRVGCVPIVNEKNEIQGMITDSDLLRLFWKMLNS